MTEPTVTYLARADRGYRAICDVCPWKSRWLPEREERARKATHHLNTHRVARGLPRIDAEIDHSRARERVLRAELEATIAERDALRAKEVQWRAALEGISDGTALVMPMAIAFARVALRWEPPALNPEPAP